MKKILLHMVSIFTVFLAITLTAFGGGLPTVGNPDYINEYETDFIIYPDGAVVESYQITVDHKGGSLIGDISRGNHKDAGLDNTPIIVPRPAKSKYDSITVLNPSDV